MAEVNSEPLSIKILLIGSGVIGSVYGAQLALTGNELWVLQHSEREAEVAKQGLQLHDVEKDKTETAPVKLAERADEREYDVVIVAVRANQLSATFDTLKTLKGTPHLLFFGNNPEGHKLFPNDLPNTMQLAFPGVSGKIENNNVEYIRIAQQPTTLEKTESALGNQIKQLFESRGFKVQETTNIDGWLAYHAVFISCIAAALMKADVDAQKLASDKKLLILMCRAIEEGFRALRKQGVSGLPQNLRILHSPLLRPIAINYWRKVMRTKGEVYFAAHTRHAGEEMEALSQWVLEKVKDSSSVGHLRELLTKPEAE